MIYLGADHRGFRVKEALKPYFHEKGYEVEDLGAFGYDKDDDYPDFAYGVALKVAKNPSSDRGILICGSGMGMDVVANKVKGIRAAVAYSIISAKAARADDDVNVITLAGDGMDVEEARQIVDAFLLTSFRAEGRYIRRLRKIEEIEERNFK